MAQSVSMFRILMRLNNMKPKKQKSMTIWFIKSPYHPEETQISESTIAFFEDAAWEFAEEVYGETKKDLESEGYIAIEGVLSWEEK